MYRRSWERSDSYMYKCHSRSGEMRDLGLCCNLLCNQDEHWQALLLEEHFFFIYKDANSKNKTTNWLTLFVSRQKILRLIRSSSAILSAETRIPLNCSNGCWRTGWRGMSNESEEGDDRCQAENPSHLCRILWHGKTSWEFVIWNRKVIETCRLRMLRDHFTCEYINMNEWIQQP